MQFNRYWKACDLSSDEKLERGIRLSADNVKTPDYVQLHINLITKPYSYVVIISVPQLLGSY